MKIESRLKTYEVFFEKELAFLEKLLEIPLAQFVIDARVYELYREHFQPIAEERLFLIDATEQSKTIETVLAVCAQMTEIPAKRNAVLLSVGGGIIQDITGFTANVLYRGIKWIFVPTTLLAQSDSCIGGKTSLNYRNYKNLLGTFYPPDEIYICPEFVNTLTQADFESGLGEVVKFNIMGGETGLAHIESCMPELLHRDGDAIEEAIRYSLQFKKPFIEADEFDRGERIKLNFAHTFGHAIETVTQYRIPHGTAVAIGMIMANRISVKRGILKTDTAKRSDALLLQVIHIEKTVLDKPLEEFVAAMRKDKKQVADSLTAVLMTDEPKDLRIIHDMTVEEVQDAFQYFKALI